MRSFILRLGLSGASKPRVRACQCGGRPPAAQAATLRVPYAPGVIGPPVSAQAPAAPRTGSGGSPRGSAASRPRAASPTSRRTPLRGGPLPPPRPTTPRLGRRSTGRPPCHRSAVAGCDPDSVRFGQGSSDSGTRRTFHLFILRVASGCAILGLIGGAVMGHQTRRTRRGELWRGRLRCSPCLRDRRRWQRPDLAETILPGRR